MTDHILKRNPKMLLRHTQDFVWNSVETELATEGSQLSEDLKGHGEARGMPWPERELVINALAYYFNQRSLSKMISVTRSYMQSNVEAPFYGKQVVGKVRAHLEKSDFDAPVLEAFYLLIVDTIARRKDLVKLEARLASLEPLVMKEMLSLNDFEHTRLIALLQHKVPVMGTRLRSIVELMASNDVGSLANSLAFTYRQTVSQSTRDLEEDVQSVTDPFINTALNSVVSGQKVTMKEYTNVANDTIRKLERQSNWLHLSVGFAAGSFFSNSANAQKLFISDMIGVDFVGLGYDLANSSSYNVFGLGIYAGGFLDYFLSEGAKLETRTLTGGDHYLKAGLFMRFRHPTNELVHIALQGGIAFNLQGESVYYLATTWNLFDLTDIL